MTHHNTVPQPKTDSPWRTRAFAVFDSIQLTTEDPERTEGSILKYEV
jgi:hypothetical protein